MYVPNTPTKALSKKEALGIGGGILAGTALITTGMIFANRYHKHCENNAVFSKFESMGDGNTFRIDDDIKNNAAPQVLELIIEAFDDIFKKYPSLVDYITAYNQYFSAINFQSPAIEERELPVDHYHITIKSFDKIPEDYLYAHATDNEQEEWNDSQKSVVKNRLQNYFIITDPQRLNIYFNFKNIPKYNDRTIKKTIAFAVGIYIYDIYSQLNYTEGKENRCLLTACQGETSAILIPESDFDDNVAPLAPLTDTITQDGSGDLYGIQINRSHFGTVFMRSIYEDDQACVGSLETIFKTGTPNLRIRFDEFRNQGFNQVHGDKNEIPQWWLTVPPSPVSA